MSTFKKAFLCSPAYHFIKYNSKTSKIPSSSSLEDIHVSYLQEINDQVKLVGLARIIKYILTSLSSTNLDVM